MSIFGKIFKYVIKKIRYNRLVPVYIPVESRKCLFKGKSAIVSGGTSGIGYSIANALSNSGCSVYLLGRDRNKLDKISKELGCKYKVIDVRNIEALKIVVNEIFDESSIDILVNSAGIASTHSFFSVEEEEFDSVMDTNVKATFFLSQFAARCMKERKIKGHILNLASASSLRPVQTAYILSKHIVKDLTEGMAKSFIPYGIIVNAIAPGPTATPMLLPESKNIDLTNEYNPLGRYATVEEISNLALFMLSDMGNYIVGSTFYITGGGGIVDRF